MPQKPNPSQPKLIAEAALFRADKTGWADLTMKDIAGKARLPLATVEKHFRDKWQILKWILKDIETETEKSVRGHLGGSWRDNLFEILMARLDLAQKHRPAFASLPRALASDPTAAPQFAPLFYKYMHDMLRLAKAPATPLHTAAFGALYIGLVHAWKNDKTPDLSKTMAVADRRLEMFEKAAGYLDPLSRPCGM